MSSALGFVAASDLGPSPSERESYEATIQSQAELLQEAREAKQSGAMKPQERQALNTLLNDILEENKKLIEQAEKQAAQIEALQKVNEQMAEKITGVTMAAKNCWTVSSGVMGVDDMISVRILSPAALAVLYRTDSISVAVSPGVTVVLY